MREQPTVPNRARPTRPVRPAPVPTMRPPTPVPPTTPVPAGRPEQRTLPAPVPEPAAPRRPVRPMALPLLLPVMGGAWWAIGAAALDPGVGTLALAVGLAAAVALGVTLRRRFGRGTALPSGGRTRLLKVAAVTVAAMLLGGAGLRMLGLGELAVPLACAIVGLALFAAVRVVDERLLAGLAGVLVVLAAVGAMAALDTPGALFPQGIVGMGAGVLCLAVAALRGDVVGELWSRRPRGR